MKKNILLLVLAVMLFEPSFGQVTKKSYEKAIDLLNCKTVELSLKDDENLMGFQEKCPCNSSSYIQVNQFLESTNLGATAALSREIESLKNIFKENWPKDIVITFLSDGVFADETKYQKIHAFAEKRKGKPEFDSYKASLKTDLTTYLKEKVTQEATSKYETKQSNIERRVSELENNHKISANTSWLNGITSQIIFVAIITSLLFTFLTLFLVPKLFYTNDNEVSNSVRNYVKKKINEAGYTRASSNNQFISSELRDASNRIRDLESQINRLKIDIEKLKQPKSTHPSIASTSNQEVRQPEPKTEILFLSTPNSDGSFNESSASNTYKDGASIYRLMKTGSAIAKFQIDEKETSIKLALQYPDKNIDPACDAENAFNSRANRISTIKMGEAELQNGKWIINSKAVIRYED